VRRGSIVGLTTTTATGETQGARVTRVAAGSDAEKFGFKPGDIIVALDGYEIFSSTRFDVRLATYPAGEKVSVTVLRDGQQTRLMASLQALIQPFLGVAPDNNASDNRGVVVGEVIRGSAAEKTGLRKDDVLVEFNGIRVRRWEDLTAQIQRSKPNDPFNVKVLRDGKELTFSGKLGER
jgi:S1-C subfamily serine protease